MVMQQFDIKQNVLQVFREQRLEGRFVFIYVMDRSPMKILYIKIDKKLLMTLYVISNLGYITMRA